jgi:hypothetical protein
VVVIPETAEYAVVVLAGKEQRNELLRSIESAIKLPPEKKYSGPVADLVKRSKFFLVEPSAGKTLMQAYKCEKAPATLVLSQRGALMKQMEGIPETAKAADFLGLLVDLKGLAGERRKEIEKDLADLGSALTGVTGWPAELLRTMQASVKTADYDALAYMGEACERLAVEQALEAAGKAKLLALGNQKKEALAKIESFGKTFKKVPEAMQVLEEAKTEIDGDNIGTILGDWWAGGAIGAAYYTGKGAQFLKAFESLGRKTAAEMGLPYLEIHAAEVLGGDQDSNGCLLYPDGAPRVRLLIMPGGMAHDTFLELGGKNGQEQCKGRDFFRQAFKNGMNYIGTCGGCFFAAEDSGLGVANVFKSGLGLWPGELSLKDTGRADPDIVLSPFHPLARGVKDGVLKLVFFNGGPTAMTPNVPGTDYVGFFRGGALDVLKGKYALIAYSPPGYKGGRVVVCAAHPETKYPAFLEGMGDYAWQHRYALPRNPLKLDEPVKGTCGDNQCQYYEVKIEAGVKSLEIALAELDGDCDLYVRFGNLPQLTMPVSRTPTPPVKTAKNAPPPPPVFQPGVWTADQRSTNKGKQDEKVKLSSPKPGVWFIAVHGNHQVLNGVAYSLSAKVQ